MAQAPRARIHGVETELIQQVRDYGLPHFTQVTSLESGAKNRMLR
jgi:hypothetical protein